MRIKSKRHMILLEVLISLAIIALCILPLLAPHLAMLKQQRKFINEMKLDHAVHLFYIDVLELLQQNKISWAQIEGKEVIPISEDMWERVGETNNFGLKGSFRFDDIKHKSNDKTQWAAHLLSLTFTFEPINCAKEEDCKKRQRVFPYTVYALRHAQTTEVDIDKKEEDPKKPATNTSGKTPPALPGKSTHFPLEKSQP